MSCGAAPGRRWPISLPATRRLPPNSPGTRASSNSRACATATRPRSKVLPRRNRRENRHEAFDTPDRGQPQALRTVERTGNRRVAGLAGVGVRRAATDAQGLQARRQRLQGNQCRRPAPRGSVCVARHQASARKRTARAAARRRTDGKERSTKRIRWWNRCSFVFRRVRRYALSMATWRSGRCATTLRAAISRPPSRPGNGARNSSATCVSPGRTARSRRSVRMKPASRWRRWPMKNRPWWCASRR